LYAFPFRESFGSLRKFFFPRITLINAKQEMTLSQTHEFQRLRPARFIRIGFNDLNDGPTIRVPFACFVGATSVAAGPRWVALCIRHQKAAMEAMSLECSVFVPR
jgi:hypothetical protein